MKKGDRMKDVSHQFRVFAAFSSKGKLAGRWKFRESRFKGCVGAVYSNIQGKQLFVLSK